ncbi:hypothetical protein CHLNCDRAFT_141485, partial [Chlorella variabilis]
MTTDGTSGISVERLDWNNYPAWAANMKFFLTTKKCWHMVIHTEPAANAEDRKADELALSYIGLCVKPLDAVSEPGRFIGYPANTKGYKILLDNRTTVISRDVTFDETSSILPKTNLPKTNLPKTNLPETIPFSDTDDNEAVGAPAEPEAPPSPPIALRRTERAAARRPASLWQDDAYRITDRTTAIVNIATTAAEPTSLEEALQSPEADQWRLAMDEEIASLAANDTWTLQPAPPSIKPIPV